MQVQPLVQIEWKLLKSNSEVKFRPQVNEDPKACVHSGVNGRSEPGDRPPLRDATRRARC